MSSRLVINCLRDRRIVATIRAMRRFVITLMLLVVPLQATWAVAAAYCQHENGAPAQHFGHHDHQHHTQADDKTSSNPLLAVDADCSSCHLSGISLLPMFAYLAPTMLVETESPPSSSTFIAVLASERPERPKWARAV